jgi:PAS domain S-box-containing protein/putative nucleotidyltransferase with HDIG domain
MQKKVMKDLQAFKDFCGSPAAFEIIFKDSPIGILVADPISKEFIFANPKICEIIGYPLKELLKLNVLKIHPKKELPKILTQFEQQFRGEKLVAKSIPVLRKDKTLIYCDISSVMMIFDGHKYLVGFFSDITDREKIKSELQHRLEFEKAVIDIAQKFAAILPVEVDSSIEVTLEIIGKLVDVDRCYIYLFANDNQLIVNAYWWGKSGSKGRQIVPQKVERKAYPWFNEIIEDADTVYVPNVAKLPPECKIEKKIWQKQGIKSLLMVPLIHHNKRIGFVGFESLAKIKIWDKNDISLLLTVSEIVSEALARKWSDKKQHESAVHLQNVLLQTVQAVAQITEKRDPYTSGHQQRTAELAAAIARKLGLPDDQIEGIRLAALIHDIGKIYVPAELLSRPGALTKDEFTLVKHHPQVGFDIIKDIDFPWPISEMILGHHERLNGSGYPKGLRGDEISLVCRILGVADVVEAMMSHRPYRSALGLDVALNEIKKGKNKLFDAKVVDACIWLFKKKGFKFKGK